MSEEWVEGSSLILVNDTYTGLNLSCNVKYAVCCTVKVSDEKAFKIATASETTKDILKKYIDVCFGACVREAYPNGAEYETLLTSIQKVNDIIKNKNAGILASSGIEIEALVVSDIILEANEKNMFERTRNMKAAITNTASEKSTVNTEWTCSCGTKNMGRFCTECGSPRKN